MQDSETSEKEPIEEAQELRARKAKFEKIGHGISKHKGPNDALNRTWSEREKIFDATKDSIMLLDAEFKILQANLATSELLGKPLDEIVGRKCWQVVHDADKPPKKCILKTARQTKKREETERYMPKKDIWLNVTVDPIIDEKGSVTGVVHIIRDITERKEAEQALAESEEKYHLLVENAPSVLWKTSEKGITVFISSNIKEVYGYTPEEVYAEGYNSWLGRIHHDDLQEVEKSFQALFDKGEKFDVEYRIKRKDGEWIWAHDAASVVREENGERYAYGVFTDITERKRVAEALIESEEKFRNLAEQSPSMIFLNKAGRIVYANQKCVEIMGYKREEFYSPDFNFLNLIAPEHHDLMKTNFHKHMQGQDVPSVECVLVTKEGKRIDVIHTTKLITLGGETTVLGILTDITERKKVEEALKVRAQILENMVEGVNVSDDEGIVFFTNQKFDSMFRYEQGELLGKHVSILNALSQQENTELINTIIKQLNIEGAWSGEFTNRRKDGTQFTTHARISELDLSGKKYWISVQEDITEHKRAEETLLSERNKLVSVFEAMADGVYIVNQQHDIQYVNPVLEKDFGAWQGCKCYQYFHDRKEVCPWCKNEQVFAGRTVRWEWYSFKNEKAYDLIDTPLRNPDGSISKLEIFRDITERKRAEEALLEYQVKLKSSTSELFLAEERERRRVADGIHDDIGTKLALAKFELQSLMKGPADSEIPALLERVSATMDKVIEDAHSLTFELSNPVLYEVGLDAAVESWLGRHIHKGHKLKYEVVSEPRPMKPDEKTRVVLFRVIRELLSNVIKHADASLVQVHIQKVGETIQVSIDDDGVGFEQSELDLPVKETGGFGLFHMREKVEYLGGVIEIESRPGEGTHVRISVPVQQSTSR